MVGSLVVALIAATASIVAAVLAWRSASVARESADGIDRRRHLVEALDHETATFQEAFAGFIRSVVGLRHGLGDSARMDAVADILACSAVLRTHPRASAPLQETVSKVTANLTRAFIEGTYKDLDIGALLESAEKDFREIVLAMREERRGLLSGDATAGLETTEGPAPGRGDKA